MKSVVENITLSDGLSQLYNFSKKCHIYFMGLITRFDGGIWTFSEKKSNYFMYKEIISQ